MLRFSLKGLFVLVGVCAVASRVGSEALEFRVEEEALSGLRGLGPAIVVESRIKTFL
jgi:hypothetical protein